MNSLILQKAKQAYSEGKNVTEFLRSEFQESQNTSEIIEIAYDLQAGSYIEWVNLNKKKYQLYCSELAEFLDIHLSNQNSILDVGTGELTTLSLMLNELKSPVLQVYAFDISWSRLFKGREFFNNNCHVKDISIIPFVADMKSIPLRSKSIDIVTSSHTLEPNGKNLQELLKELFRVAKTKCVLFEPSYELNSDEGKQRMERLGFIRDIEGTVTSLGGKVLDIKPLVNPSNPLNPTACYVIEPPELLKVKKHDEPIFSVPGSDYSLTKNTDFYVSSDTGLLFPILADIPILKMQSGILGNSYFNTEQAHLLWPR